MLLFYLPFIIFEAMFDSPANKHKSIEPDVG